MKVLLKYQQSLVGRKRAILVLPTNNWPTIQARAERIAAKVAQLKPGRLDRNELGLKAKRRTQGNGRLCLLEYA